MVGWRNYFDLKQSETGAHYFCGNGKLEGRESELRYIALVHEKEQGGEGGGTLGRYLVTAFNRPG